MTCTYGIETIRLIQQNKNLAAIPVIIMASEFNREEVLAEAPAAPEVITAAKEEPEEGEAAAEPKEKKEKKEEKK